MIRPMLLSFCILLHVVGFGQAKSCDCAANLDSVVKQMEKNYVGFEDKVKPQNKAAYQQWVQQLRLKAKPVKAAIPCFNIIRTYIRYFGDRHLGFAYMQDGTPAYSSTTHDPTYFNETKLTALEGIWQNADSTEWIAIKATGKNRFQAYLLESSDSTKKKGTTLFNFVQAGKRYLVTYPGIYNAHDFFAVQRNNLLLVGGETMWGKQGMRADEAAELRTWRNNNKGLAVESLSAQTVLVRIPSFYQNDEAIANLIAQHDVLIRSKDNLIIDMRNNGGGSSGWVPLIPYLITQPIQQGNSWIRVTPENVAKKLPDLAWYVNNPIPNELKKYFPEHILAAYKKAYEELPKTTAAYYPIPSVVFPLDSVLKQPKKVAILVDEYGGSSTEYFFFLSQQSAKTTRYGNHTIGMMDYEGNGTPTQLPYGEYILTIPISRSSWTAKAPTNGKGFIPDVLLTHLPYAQWVPYVQQIMEKQQD